MTALDAGAPLGAAQPDGAGLRKRSIAIRGHRTSVSLEDAFWRQLNAIARARAQSLSGLVASIDAGRGRSNLSSAIRIFVLGSKAQ